MGDGKVDMTLRGVRSDAWSPEARKAALEARRAHISQPKESYTPEQREQIRKETAWLGIVPKYTTKSGFKHSKPIHQLAKELKEYKEREGK